jgi:hypothetical protein
MCPVNIPIGIIFFSDFYTVKDVNFAVKAVSIK